MSDEGGVSADQTGGGERSGDSGSEERRMDDGGGGAAADTDAEGASTARALAERESDELAVLIEQLRAENGRLREEYARARRVEHRRTALGLALIGGAGVLAGVAFPAAREVLFVLAAIGLFGAVLTWYLTPERPVSATVGRSVYDAVADTGSRLRDELGLQDTSVYAPVEDRGVGVPVRLFVPRSPGYELPDPAELDDLFVLPEAEHRRGVALDPCAGGTVAEFRRTTTEPVADEPAPLAAQLSDALVEGFELVDRADPEVDAASRRITFVVEGGVYGEPTAFDHPVASFVGTGVALGLDRAITVETERGSDGAFVTCRW